MRSGFPNRVTDPQVKPGPKPVPTEPVKPRWIIPLGQDQGQGRGGGVGVGGVGGGGADPARERMLPGAKLQQFRAQFTGHVITAITATGQVTRRVFRFEISPALEGAPRRCCRADDLR